MKNDSVLTSDRNSLDSKKNQRPEENSRNSANIYEMDIQKNQVRLKKLDTRSNGLKTWAWQSQNWKLTDHTKPKTVDKCKQKTS